MTDIIDALTGINAGDVLDEARSGRPAAKQHAQGSFKALFQPIDASQVSLPERAAVALFVARLHGQQAAVEFYGSLLRETGGGDLLEPIIVAEADRAAGTGPYGAFRAENADESVPGVEYAVDSVEASYAVADRLAAALEHAHFLVFHPRDASRERLQQLLDDGWSTTGVVTLSQLVSFLTFQLRVIHGLSVLRETAGGSGTAPTTEALAALASEVARAAAARLGDGAGVAPEAAAEQLPAAPKVDEPPRFTQESLGWKPWLTPLPAAEFTDLHREALVEPERIHMPYFRLLARDPEALRERTLTDMDIFYNTEGGLPRADRELAAAAASRFNGCVFCASVHSRFATEQGADRDEVQRLLDEGVGARVNERWDALVDATVALTATPSRFGPDDLARLRGVGLDEPELLDMVQAGAFFNWANRLMLSLGEPTQS
ncbi:hypothetical protein GCM10028820_17520 [Tessaracoccus terricola]